LEVKECGEGYEVDLWIDFGLTLICEVMKELTFPAMVVLRVDSNTASFPSQASEMPFIYLDRYH